MQNEFNALRKGLLPVQFCAVSREVQPREIGSCHRQGFAGASATATPKTSSHNNSVIGAHPEIEIGTTLLSFEKH